MLLERLSPALAGQEIAATGYAGLAVLVAVSLAAAHAATRWIDTPARPWLKRRLQALTAAFARVRLRGAGASGSTR